MRLNIFCRDAARLEIDMVMAWSVDRLRRSLQHLVGFLSELHALKIDLFLRQQGLDTTTPAGKAMFQMMGVFAEFERAMIAERVRAGLARARGEGKRLGRPPTPPHWNNASVRLWRPTEMSLSGRSVSVEVGLSRFIQNDCLSRFIQNGPRRLKQIKGLHWQTPARGSFDHQRLFGALANRITLKCRLASGRRLGMAINGGNGQR